MTKYYCDICGQEVDKITEFVLPVLEDKDIWDNQGFILKRIKTYNPKSMELCRHCKNIIGDFTKLLKYLPYEDSYKKMTIKVDFGEE